MVVTGMGRARKGVVTRKTVEQLEAAQTAAGDKKL